MEPPSAPSAIVLNSPRRLMGTVVALAAALCFACMNGVVAHAAGRLDATACQASRGLVGVVALLPWTWRELPRAFSRRGWPLWLQCLCGALASQALFHNVKVMGVGQAAALSYLAPVIAALIAPLLFSERLQGHQLGGIAVMIGGATCLQLSVAQHPPAEALVIGVLGALCGALAMMALKRAAQEHSPRLACWTFCLCSMATAAALGTASTAGELVTAWGLALLVGSLGTGGQLLLSWSFTLLPAALAGALSLSTLLLSVLLESLYTGHWPSPAQWVGYSLLCGGLVLLQLRRVRLRAPRPMGASPQ